MTKARIYQPDRNAMQSGKAKSQDWLLEYMPETPYFTDGLMGWTGMSDTLREVKLRFNTADEAVAYATRQNLPYEVELPPKRRLVKKSYADNFAFSKASR
ncbi:MAG: ETC complex I subunit [Rickettsiales bacterium]|nr:ETC complex I subunit [Rickettsiales bacterium]